MPQLRSACLCLGAMVLAATPRPADAHVGSETRLDFVVGGHFFDRDVKLAVPRGGDGSDLARSAAALGVRFGWEMVKRLSLEAELLALPTASRSIRGDVLGLAYRAHAMYRFLDGWVQPFVLAGYGGLSAWSAHQEKLPDGTVGAFHFGVGARFPLSHAFGLRIDVRGLLPPSAKEGERVAFDAECLVSASLAFGGPRGEVAGKDVDRDGIPDERDKCPNQTGIGENDGCPDTDADNDGVVDRLDKCPNTPQGTHPDMNRPGCPEPDSDADGVLDSMDKCPNEPAGPKPDPEKPGCPTRDRDNDGVLDREDKCPDTPGVKENNGCPDTDADSDGVVDRLDKCPNQAGPKANEGCPLPEQVKKFTGKIEGITFEANSAKILPKSFKVLDEAVKVLKEFEKLPLTIEGHTSSEGKREKNIELSKARAEAVKAYLVSKGIDPKRIFTVGYGPDKPVADNKTAKGRAANRRIEFKVEAQE